MAERNHAVCVRGVTKAYGRSRKAQVVLDNLDMTVEKGTIYGLLGASGCGKTTLLTCIVGRRSIASGQIWVLGGKPGSKGSGVPGPRLGYMPQEIALMREFTVWDAIAHFGWIYGLSNEKIKERFDFLTNLLELPPSNKAIKSLSGGQQRRVSLAVALVHDPELLILDEPTVGLDPVLRQSIWDHLIEISTKYNKTIIITTHYIEEARQAHKIGLMRSGKLLAEGSPENLLKRFHCSSVEEVFLRLSSKQEYKALMDSTVVPISYPEGLDIVEMSVREPGGLVNQGYDGVAEENRIDVISQEPKEAIISKEFEPEEFSGVTKAESPWRTFAENTITKAQFTSKGHAKALLTKNAYRLLRHPGAIIFIFFFPMLEICTFYLSVGGMPQGLKIGIVNHELQNFSTCADYKKFLGAQYGGSPTVTDEGLSYCLLNGLSCSFLERITDDVAIQVPYDDLETAMKDAKKGLLIAVIRFVSNFSMEFETRLDLGSATPEATVFNSELPIWMDMSRRQSALLLEKQLRELHALFLRDTLKECDIAPGVGAVPLQFHKPVYGTEDTNFSQFMTPGVVTTMTFFLAVSVTATIIVVERLDGIWDRTLLAGVSSAEILLSHIVIESLCILLQVAEVIIFVFYVFGVPCQGSFFDICVLLMLQGFCGMCGGFVVSVSCNTVSSSNFISMGSFYPVLVLSGLMWPIEGMPAGLRIISESLPTTLATTSLRNIIEKGWTITDDFVYQGYLISILWIIIFSVLSLIVVRIRK